MGIGFSSILEEHEAALQEYVPTTATVISCPACEKKFYYHDYGKENSADACECENRNITIGLVPVTDSEEKFYIAVRYKTDYPEFSEIAYDEYLKIKKRRKKKKE